MLIRSILAAEATDFISFGYVARENKVGKLLLGEPGGDGEGGATSLLSSYSDYGLGSASP